MKRYIFAQWRDFTAIFTLADSERVEASETSQTPPTSQPAPISGRLLAATAIAIVVGALFVPFIFAIIAQESSR